MNTQKLFREITEEQFKSDVPAFRPVTQYVSTLKL